MTEYIERKKILESLGTNYYDPSEEQEGSFMEGWKCGFNAGTGHAIHDVLCTKPADVRPVVRGRWEWNEDDGHCYCTVCGSVSPEIDQNGDECDCPNFCPNCGANMRKEEQDGSD